MGTEFAMNDAEKMGKTSPSAPVNATAVTIESWDTLFQYWHDKKNLLNWNCIFMLPVWLKTWWDSFGKGLKPSLCAVWHQQKLTGIAPLIVDGNTAHLMGSSDLSDYVDVIVVPGQESDFFSSLISHLRREGITFLDAGQIRADSSVISVLKRKAEKLGCEVDCDPAERIYVLDLPQTWGEYLNLLSGKERHEIRRKLRRLDKAGRSTYRVLGKKDEVHGAMDEFIRLFRSNASAKAQFMTAAMESYFRSLADTLAGSRLLKLAFLNIDDVPAAMTICIDYRSTVYLYNNGYDKKYRALGVGLLSKVLSIQHSIQQGRKKYDFLKGDERYKMRLGGAPVQLYRCWVKLK